MDRIDVIGVMDAEIRSLPEIAGLVGASGVSCDAAEAVARMEKAREAVAALIETTTALLAYRHGNYPVEGYLRDNDASRAQLDAVATALARIEAPTTRAQRD